MADSQQQQTSGTGSPNVTIAPSTPGSAARHNRRVQRRFQPVLQNLAATPRNIFRIVRRNQNTPPLPPQGSESPAQQPVNEPGEAQNPTSQAATPTGHRRGGRGRRRHESRMAEENAWRAKVAEMTLRDEPQPTEAEHQELIQRVQELRASKSEAEFALIANGYAKAASNRRNEVEKRKRWPKGYENDKRSHYYKYHQRSVCLGPQCNYTYGAAYIEERERLENRTAYETAKLNHYREFHREWVCSSMPCNYHYNRLYEKRNFEGLFGGSDEDFRADKVDFADSAIRDDAKAVSPAADDLSGGNARASLNSGLDDLGNAYQTNGGSNYASYATAPPSSHNTENGSSIGYSIQSSRTIDANSEPSHGAFHNGINGSVSSGHSLNHGQNDMKLSPEAEIEYSGNGLTNGAKQLDRGNNYPRQIQRGASPAIPSSQLTENSSLESQTTAESDSLTALSVVRGPQENHHQGGNWRVNRNHNPWDRDWRTQRQNMQDSLSSTESISQESQYDLYSAPKTGYVGSRTAQEIYINNIELPGLIHNQHDARGIFTPSGTQSPPPPGIEMTFNNEYSTPTDMPWYDQTSHVYGSALVGNNNNNNTTPPPDLGMRRESSNESIAPSLEIDSASNNSTSQPLTLQNSPQDVTANMTAKMGEVTNDATTSTEAQIEEEPHSFSAEGRQYLNRFTGEKMTKDAYFRQYRSVPSWGRFVSRRNQQPVLPNYHRHILPPPGIFVFNNNAVGPGIGPVNDEAWPATHPGMQFDPPVRYDAATGYEGFHQHAIPNNPNLESVRGHDSQPWQGFLPYVAAGPELAFHSRGPSPVVPDTSNFNAGVPSCDIPVGSSAASRPYTVNRMTIYEQRARLRRGIAFRGMPHQVDTVLNSNADTEMQPASMPWMPAFDRHGPVMPTHDSWGFVELPPMYRPPQVRLILQPDPGASNSVGLGVENSLENFVPCEIPFCDVHLGHVCRIHSLAIRDFHIASNLVPEIDPKEVLYQVPKTVRDSQRPGYLCSREYRPIWLDVEGTGVLPYVAASGPVVAFGVPMHRETSIVGHHQFLAQAIGGLCYGSFSRDLFKAAPEVRHIVVVLTPAGLDATMEQWLGNGSDGELEGLNSVWYCR
jgi:hypothetical protein